MLMDEPSVNLEMLMSTWIHHIETAVPEHAYPQDYAAERMTSWLPDPRTQRLARFVYKKSGIETRHSVIGDWQPGATPELFKSDDDGHLIEPDTGTRNRFYIKKAGPLAEKAARAALKNCPGHLAKDVTHLITVSCTGFYNPGLDFHLVRALGLSESVERYNLGFMGCYAAFPALRMAQQFCQVNPQAVVMVVCLELCSLHLQINGNTDSLLGNAIFADGTAVAIVSSRTPKAHRAAFRLDRFVSAMAPEGGGDMAWEIGQNGFNIVLSSYVPDIIAANIKGIVQDTAGQADEVDLWAIHPGGKAILDKVQHELGLTPEHVMASRNILRDFGNMSSVTILFVLQHMLEHQAEQSARVCAMAFGPGLTIETAMLQLQPAETFAPVLRPSLTPAN
jgi:predicted naringenin-chalcone synthase